MSEPSLGQAIGATAGCGVSLAGFFWLATAQPPPLADTLPRVGFVRAMLSVVLALAFSWAVLFAFIIRKRAWSRHSCKYAGLLFFLPGFYFWIPFSDHSMAVGNLLICSGSIVVYFTRKLAFPKMTAEEFYTPEPPLSLFPH